VSTLADVAHARAGDKGDTSIILLAPYDPSDFGRLSRMLAVPMVAAHFGVPASSVTIHPLPELSAFTIVIRNRLDGGVTRSRASDPHGKTLSGHLLDLALIDEPSEPDPT
jgi:hypothetical protein